MNSICSRGLNNNTLVHDIDIHKGSQWALHNATVVHVYGYEESPCTYSCLSLPLTSLLQTFETDFLNRMEIPIYPLNPSDLDSTREWFIPA